MDHYQVLGLSRTASKAEIKDAFLKHAMQFHPDKHVQSPKTVKDEATLRFRRVSEAYEVLIDDVKRAHYNLGYGRGFGSGGGRYNGYGYSSRPHSSSYGYSYGRTCSEGAFALKLEVFLRFLNTRVFLLNAAFACALLGGSVFIDMGREALWKMQNPGKSFEEAMESIEKARTVKDRA